ncbi:phenylacetate--CoA ligase family protein [Paenibacillus humicus]|uniref:phenylacetate--CoA ligase family protein n=1 Tax=Paenibacillus humicus TaxID=412861 RepID=UPI003D2A0F28
MDKALLLKIVDEAIKNTDFYKRHYENLEAGYRFEQLPFLKKEDIRADYKQLVRHGTAEEECIPYWTSGSTGIPVKYIRSKEEFTKATLEMSKQRRKVDHRAFCGTICHFDKIVEPIQYVYHQHEKKELILSLYNNSPERYELFISAIKEFKPSIIQGYASALYQFAKYVLETGRSMEGISLVESRSEHLSSSQKKIINKAFNATVRSFYGLAEIFPVAYECECGNLHICEKNVYVEIADEDESGIGEIVITSLHSKTMPLIRYRTGDIGQFRRMVCQCGSHEPVIELSHGRLDDVVSTPDGTVNSVILRRLYRFFYDEVAIAQLQIIQRGIHDFTVNIIPGSPPSIEAENLIVSFLKGSLPQKINVEIKWVNTLEPHPVSGKVKLFFNELMMRGK